MGGIVYLVGAGPGDPGLLTLRGAELLGEADVVVWDFLASEELLKLAKSGAKLIYAGKSGSDHTLKQHEINALLVEEAKKGHKVVRLKGGDPYIFGRGGEEAEALAKAGVKFEEVPGISSTCAAPAYAGVPLTHREHSSQVVFITGHENPDKPGSAHDWAALAKIGTLACVMGAENLPGICESLIKNGKDPSTMAAMIHRGTTPWQKTVTAALKDLPQKAKEAGIGPPALLVVGSVVSLRSALNWFEGKPLFGRKILITRTREQAGRLSRLLREEGAAVVERPVIKIEEISPNILLDETLRRIRDYHYLILTSPNGARIFMESLFAAGNDSRILYSVKIAVMGPGTAEALKPYGIDPDIVPESFISESLVERFKRENPGTAVICRAEEARDVLPDSLRDMGFEVELAPLYRTTNIGPLKTDSSFLDQPPSLSLLTSASTARGLAGIIPQERRKEYPCGAIGPITAKEAEAHGFNVVFTSKEHSIPALVGEVKSYFAKTG
jgi:uroporphyrinogen III methyltransferase/synthase